jgi:sialidase-1
VLRSLTLLALLSGIAAPVHAQATVGGVPDPTYPGLHGWYDAADGVNGPGSPSDGASVTSWADRSVSGNDLVRSSTDAGQRPTYLASAANGLPAVDFDGNDYLWGDSGAEFGTLAGSKTILAVVEVDTADGGYVFDSSSGAGRNAAFTGQIADPGRWHQYTGQVITVGPQVSTGVAQVHTFSFDAAGHSHRINGVEVSSGSGALDSLAGIVLGARFNLANRFDGRISELLVYSELLGSADRDAVEGYLLTKHPVSEPPPQPTFTDVFDGGVGYPSYRIPSVLETESGILLAFAEGRASLADHAENDIVMRRSADGGATWEPLVTLADEGTDSLNNPCALQVESGPHAGRILLMYQRYPVGCHESCVVPGHSGPNICRGYLMHSDDDGLTWSAPREVTTEVKRPTGATSIASGPGVGIQLRRGPFAGRILMPFNQGPNPWKVYAAYSDDGGDTWAYGALCDDSQTSGCGNEVQMVELVDGTVMLNSRNFGGIGLRKRAFSFDGGLSWTPLEDDPGLAEPGCMASVLRHTDPLDGISSSRIAYAGPNSTTGRVDGTVHLSYDEGQTWSVSKLLKPGFYAYSVLASLGNGDLGVLFESANYDRITFARVPVAWLTDGADCVGTARTYCAAGANSAGPGCHLAASGSLELSANALVLTATGAPSSVPGLFFYGPGQTQQPFGNGFRCVSGQVFRMSPVAVTSGSGVASRAVDLTTPPEGGGPGEITAGSTWNYQFWYRDTAAGGAGFNLSDGLSLTFCP